MQVSPAASLNVTAALPGLAATGGAADDLSPFAGFLDEAQASAGSAPAVPTFGLASGPADVGEAGASGMIVGPGSSVASASTQPLSPTSPQAPLLDLLVPSSNLGAPTSSATPSRAPDAAAPSVATDLFSHAGALTASKPTAPPKASSSRIAAAAEGAAQASQNSAVGSLDLGTDDIEASSAASTHASTSSSSRSAAEGPSDTSRSKPDAGDAQNTAAITASPLYAPFVAPPQLLAQSGVEATGGPDGGPAIGTQNSLASAASAPPQSARTSSAANLSDVSMTASATAASTPVGAGPTPTPDDADESDPAFSVFNPAPPPNANLQQSAASPPPLAAMGQAGAATLQSESTGTSAGGISTDAGRGGGPRRPSAVAAFKSSTSAGVERSTSGDAAREPSPATSRASGASSADPAPVHADDARLGSESAQPDLAPPPSAAATVTAAALGAASSAATTTTTGTASGLDASAAQPGAQTAADLSAQMAQKLAGQNTRFDLQLTPDGLGRVDVAVRIDAKGALSAALSFEKPEAASLMHAHAGDLQQSLAQAGFHVSGSALSFSTSDQGRGQGQAQTNPQSFFSGGGAQGGGDGQGRSAGRAFNAAALAAAQTDRVAASSQGLSGQGLAARGLDIKI